MYGGSCSQHRQLIPINRKFNPIQLRAHQIYLIKFITAPYVGSMVYCVGIVSAGCCHDWSGTPLLVQAVHQFVFVQRLLKVSK
jgi:hypothetical protein